MKMKPSEAFKQAQIAVLNADMPISTKKEVLEVLLWQEYFEKIVEDKKEKTQCDTLTAE
jgi:hypothetical protein